MHLAQLNIAFPTMEMDDPKFAGFVDNLDKINNLAQSMDGFVWRYSAIDDQLLQINTPWPNAIINMSVWEGAEQLKHFVWNTVHKQIMNRKAEWFEESKSQTFVMWWIEEGHVPTLEEAKIRLDQLNENGNSDFAFGWSHLAEQK